MRRLGAGHRAVVRFLYRHLTANYRGPPSATGYLWAQLTPYTADLHLLTSADDLHQLFPTLTTESHALFRQTRFFDGNNSGS